MECPTCGDTQVEAFCRSCGKGVCVRCRGEWRGAPHCPECLEKLGGAGPGTEQPKAEEAPTAGEALPTPRASSQAPPLPPPAAVVSGGPSVSLPADAPHPLLAGILGFVPGLGAVYNGQYVKGFLHVILLGIILTIANADPAVGPLFIPMAVLFVLYMPIEAVRTARAIRSGRQVEEFTGLIGYLFRNPGRSPAGGAALITLGVVLLLFTLGLFDLREALRFWPVLLILFGAYRVYLNVTAVRGRRRGGESADEEADSAAAEG